MKLKRGFYRKRRRVIQMGPEGQEVACSDAAVSQECLGGCRLSGFPRFHLSREEATYCNKLKAQRDTVGEPAQYEAEVSFPLRDAKGRQCGVHRVDFLLSMKDGRRVVRAYKGLMDQVAKLKHALFTFNYPEIEIEVVGWKNLG